MRLLADVHISPTTVQYLNRLGHARSALPPFCQLLRRMMTSLPRQSNSDEQY